MKELTRRMMLQYGAAAMAMPLIGCEKKQDDIYPSSLYFYNSSSYLTAPRLEQIIGETRKAFDNVGISFKRAEEIKTFPELSGLDILMIYLESRISLSYPRSYGRFGLDIIDYLSLKQRIPSLPYSDDEAKTHIGYVDAHGLSLHKSKEEEQMKLIAAISIHEIAHGLGAPHTEPAEGCEAEICINNDDYMMARRPHIPSNFYYSSVERMKKFIKDSRVSTDFYGMSRDQRRKVIYDLRLKSLSDSIKYTPFPEW